MKKLIFFLILSILIFYYSFQERILYKDEGFIRAGNNKEEVIIYGPRYSKYGNTIAIPAENYQLEMKGKNKLNIFKLDICQMDREGSQEIVLGVYKKSPWHRVMAKRIFIYNFDNNLVAKFRCSRLSKPLIDYIVKKDEVSKIYALLKTKKAKNVEVYIYDNFSFKRIYKYDLEKYEDVKLKDGYIYVKDKGRWKMYEKIIN